MRVLTVLLLCITMAGCAGPRSFSVAYNIPEKKVVLGVDWQPIQGYNRGSSRRTTFTQTQE